MFIKLSVREGINVYINKSHIAAFGPLHNATVKDTGCKGSWIIVAGSDQDVHVRETPEEIMEMLK